MFEEVVVYIFRGFIDIVFGLYMLVVYILLFLDMVKYLYIFLVGFMIVVIVYD